MKRSRFGQNFLFDPSIAERIVENAALDPSDTVVEIGPGYGIMTRILARRVGKLIAIELDTAICRRLAADLSEFNNITLVNADAMKYDLSRLGPFKVVANIPYYITSPLIFKLMEEGKENLPSMTLTLQKEVAERITATPNSKAYGVLSLMIQFFGASKLLFKIPAGAFTPKPKVDSAVIRIDRHAAPPVILKNRALFDKIIKVSFAGRRKMIANTLKTLYPDIRPMLNEVNIEPSRRPETLSMEDFAAISNRIVETYGDGR